MRSRAAEYVCPSGEEDLADSGVFRWWWRVPRTLPLICRLAQPCWYEFADPTASSNQRQAAPGEPQSISKLLNNPYTVYRRPARSSQPASLVCCRLIPRTSSRAPGFGEESLTAHKANRRKRLRRHRNASVRSHRLFATGESEGGSA